MKKKQVEDFFKLFIKDYLVGDILELEKIKKNEYTGLRGCTIPLAMTVFSGVDLLGFLFGNNKKTDETENHFFEFFRISESSFIKNQYNKVNIKKLALYRHGIMHTFFPKFQGNKIGICKSDSESLFITDSFIESLNVSVFSNDFKIAVSYFEELIMKNSDEKFFDNILNGIKNLGYSNELAKTTTKMTTSTIITQNKKSN